MDTLRRAWAVLAERQFGPRRPWWYTVVAAIAAVPVWLAQDWVTGTFWPYFVNGWLLLTSLPIGVVGLAVFGFVVVAVVVLAFDSQIATAIRVRSTRTERRRPTPEETNEIEAARAFWNDESREASDKLAELLYEACRHFEDKGDPFSSLIRSGPQKDLAAARRDFEIRLEEDRPSLREIQRALGAFTTAYALAAAWVNRCRFADPFYPNREHYKHSLSVWCERHSSFAKSYSAVRNRKAFEGNKDLPMIQSDASQIEFQQEFIFRDIVRNSRVRRLYGRLKATTESEDEFLHLFAATSNPMVFGQPETYMDSDVYRAGQRLVDDGILMKSLRNDTTERFVVPPDVIVALERASLIQSARPAVDIDLRTVRGSGSSGGGVVGERRRR